MAGNNNKALARANQKLSNVFTSRGRMDQLGTYLCSTGRPINFVVSGGTDAQDRYEPLYLYLDTFLGRCPMIILHNKDSALETIVETAWQQAGAGSLSPLWIVNKQNPKLEPFLGMEDMQVVAAMRQVAAALDYPVTPRFERVVRGHIRLLKELKLPVSLTGFDYLCKFRNLADFYNNILSLPCGEREGRRIWQDLGAEDAPDSFDLFRAVVENLAADAQHSSWSRINKVGTVNCRKAIRNNATMLLCVDGLHTRTLLPYLVEELKDNNDTPFILLIEDVKLVSEPFLNYLRQANTGCSCGILSKNIVDAIGGDEGNLTGLAEKMNCFILFKHGTGKTATALSEIMGRCDQTRRETSEGTARGFFAILPRDRHQDTRTTTENRFRVMPEHITALRQGSAVVFDVNRDEIIYFN